MFIRRKISKKTNTQYKEECASERGCAPLHIPPSRTNNNWVLKNVAFDRGRGE